MCTYKRRFVKPEKCCLDIEFDLKTAEDSAVCAKQGRQRELYYQSVEIIIILDTKETFETLSVLLENAREHILAPPEWLRALGLTGVNPRVQPKESGGDSKAI